MAIPPVRFNDLTSEFNVPMVSIGTSDPTQIINSGSNAITSLSKDVLGVISQISQDLSISDLFGQLQSYKNSLENSLGLTNLLKSYSTITNTIRQVRGLGGSTFDDSILNSKDLSTYLSNLFMGDPVVQTVMRSINQNSLNSVTQNVTTGRPIPPTVVLPNMATPPPGSTKAITVSALGDQNITPVTKALNQITDDHYNQTPVDNYSLLRQTVTVANLAYNSNMSGVMLSLANTPNMTSQVFSRATSIVLTEQAKNGNSAAVLDMTQGPNSVLGTTNTPMGVDSFPGEQTPSIVSDLVSTFTKPTGSSEKNMVVLADAFMTSLNTVAPGWNVSDYDGILSTDDLVNVSSDLTEVLEAKLMNNIVNPSDLTTAFDSDQDAVIAALLTIDPAIEDYLRTLSYQTTTNFNTGF